MRVQLIAAQWPDAAAGSRRGRASRGTARTAGRVPSRRSWRAAPQHTARPRRARRPAGGGDARSAARAERHSVSLERERGTAPPKGSLATGPSASRAMTDCWTMADRSPSSRPACCSSVNASPLPIPRALQRWEVEAKRMRTRKLRTATGAATGPKWRTELRGGRSNGTSLPQPRDLRAHLMRTQTFCRAIVCSPRPHQWPSATRPRDCRSSDSSPPERAPGAPPQRRPPGDRIGLRIRRITYDGALTIRVYSNSLQVLIYTVSIRSTWRQETSGGEKREFARVRSEPPHLQRHDSHAVAERERELLANGGEGWSAR